MKKRLKSNLLVLLAALLLTGCVRDINTDTADTSQPASNTQASADTVIVTDSLGREVTLPSEDVKAVVSNAYNMEIVTAIGAADQVVGVDWYIWQDTESWPGRFTQEMQVGKDPDFDYEAIISLAPDVLVMAENGGWEDAEKNLSPFGIEVLVCNAYYTDEFFENVVMLGQAFGMQQGAETLSSYFSEKLDYIDAQLESVPKKTLYFEYRIEARTTVPGDYFFNMIEYSHADNVFGDAEARDVDPEAIITANPEYIVKVSAPDVTSSYIPPTQEDHAAIYEELVGRPGWDEISAVQNDNILLLSHFVHGGASKLVGTMYVAKFLYPEQLPDLHPEQVFHDWLTKFMQLEYIEGHTYPAYTLDN